MIGLNEEELGTRTALQAELFSIYQSEEHNCIQKSKLNWFWLSLGDENMGFFHRILNANKRRNLFDNWSNMLKAVLKRFCGLVDWFEFH